MVDRCRCRHRPWQTCRSLHKTQHVHELADCEWSCRHQHCRFHQHATSTSTLERFSRWVFERRKSAHAQGVHQSHSFGVSKNMEIAPRSPPTWMINWRDLVGKAMHWARHAQRFLKTPMTLTSTTAWTAPPGTKGPKTSCQHRYIKRSGNRHGSFALCLECNLQWKYD